MPTDQNNLPSSDPDATGPRIRAYLASMRPEEGEMREDVGQAYHRGRGLLERLAIDDDSDLETAWDAGQCADVLTFMDMSEPVTPQAWWSEEPRVSHIAGYHEVLDLLATSMRGLTSGEARARQKRDDEVEPAQKELPVASLSALHQVDSLNDSLRDARAIVVVMIEAVSRNGSEDHTLGNLDSDAVHDSLWMARKQLESAIEVSNSLWENRTAG